MVCIMSNTVGHSAHEDPIRLAPDEDRLYRIAEPREGYFTTSDAAAAGYSRSLLSHHVASGMLERVDHGVYRLSRFPESSHADLIVAWLRAGESSAISHERALGLYGLSDILPHEVHVTVPRTASRRRHGPRLHTSELGKDDVAEFEGVRITTVERTITDVARAGLADELIVQAIDEALQRGLTPPRRGLRGQRRRAVAEQGVSSSGHLIGVTQA